MLSKQYGRVTYWLGVLVVIGFFWVNTVGFLDTETGSALGCGHHWPLCNEDVTPHIWGLTTLIEFLYRAIVGIVTLLLLVFTLVYIFCAMYIGAFIASHGTGGALQSWPLPMETYSQVGYAFYLDVLHRAVVLVLLLVLLHGTCLTYQVRQSRPDLFRISVLSVVLVCAQALSGLALILTRLSMWAFLTYVTIISFLFATICLLTMQVLPGPRRKSLRDT